MRVEGGPGINHVRELEQSRRDKWPSLPSAFGLWISHYRMRGASHLYAAAQHGRDRPHTSIPLILNAVAVGESSLSVCELFLLSCIEAPGLWHTQSSVCNLHQRAVLACLLRPPINASMLHLFLSYCFCCCCKIMSSLFQKEGRTQTWTEISFGNRWWTGGRYF